MSYNTFTFVGINSVISVEVHPTWGFDESYSHLRRDRVTLGGHMHTYRMEDETLKYQFPLTFISSSDRFVLQRWWKEQAEVKLQVFPGLIMFPNSVAIGFSVIGRFVNGATPLNLFSPGQHDQWSGVIQFHSSRGGDKTPGI